MTLSVYNPYMDQAWAQKVRSLSPDKAMNMAAYGESVAAYRYRTLAEKFPTGERHRIFNEMADEEQSHHLEIQQILRTTFPQADFVLSNEDKAMVVVGPRMLEVTARTPLASVLETIVATEKLTGSFYAALQDTFVPESLRPRLKAMAEECFEHAALLKKIPDA